VRRGLLIEPVHVQFVMGIPNALPARRKLLEFLISELNELLPGATWSCRHCETSVCGESMVPGTWGALSHRS